MFIKYLNENEKKINLKDIDVNNFNNLSQIYSFTTENIAGYYKYLDFSNKNVLTVSASGDHIINAFYKGAQQVCGFDINYLSLLYTELKLVALLNLEYKEFLQFFMINDKNDLNKNKNAFDYKLYKNKIRKELSKNTSENWDLLYQDFNNNGFELRNSYIFNNKYDNNNIKLKSNLYLKSEADYNIAKKNIIEKEIKLLKSDYRNINCKELPSSEKYDIILLSNISDYIKNIYNNEDNYLKKYIKEVKYNYKTETNKVVCAYLYDINNPKSRSQIDCSFLRKEVFNEIKTTYEEKYFKSVINGCTDAIIII